jgi:hypothetical protein
VSNDPVPPGILLDLEEAFRILSALEDALNALAVAGSAVGLQDELATMINLLHVRLGWEVNE